LKKINDKYRWSTTVDNTKLYLKKF
jgi:hypothetical protein